MGEDLSALDLTDGFISPVLKIDGVRELERVLSCWVNESDEPTVGPIGSRGGSAVVAIQMLEDRFVLNRDTRRSAVRTFLAAAARAGDARDLPWCVTFNRDGKVDRVTYRLDQGRTPGWYAYLDPPQTAPRLLR